MRGFRQTQQTVRTRGPSPKETDLKARLDAIDWNILKELQQDGRMTNVELARRVGISAPPCLRRVRALEEAGLIRGYRTLLDEKQLGYDVTAFAMVGLHSQTEADLLAFEDQVKSWTLVRESYMLSGEVDFLLKCVAPDLQAFQNFVIQELTATQNVDSVRTALTIRKTKDEAIVPIED
ncbi:MAG: Lrp/AsnC family transcriptional regulator [Roseibium sp.]|nr:Lrp/AsnC family transcriptional regulator [Roseibium sp.]